MIIAVCIKKGEKFFCDPLNGETSTQCDDTVAVAVAVAVFQFRLQFALGVYAAAVCNYKYVVTESERRSFHHHSPYVEPIQTTSPDTHIYRPPTSTVTRLTSGFVLS